MSSCGCGCGSGCSCSCGGACGSCCKMFPDLGGERGTTAAGIIDLGVATLKGHIEGFEVANGSEGGGCDCSKCKCGSSCSCACCGCN
ncbi:unnamed protein product [Musa acuminata subsp. malaccensis]|uniref:Metallothionein-like protein n=1 Tax=Musa acuminata subsp. malaccensis TaxID=214687 RepID=A0A804IDN7_MUSAM|nr:PREDICTED: metallothionein-like protein type 2 [Musa acuminata subsp. malaccensis]CAG1850608.1 unnamed protein product [Musa acuminata subsp. malaccensis]